MKALIVSLLPVVALILSGCGPGDHDHDRDHAGHDHGPAHEHKHEHEHEHEAPHGGAAVVLGDEAFHIEIVRDGEAGTLSAYVLDGHMENFVRVTNASLAITIDGREALQLGAVANAATGETVGDTSQFAAGAEWLKTTTNFSAVIPMIEIRGQSFTNVAFKFPEGNE